VSTPPYASTSSNLSGGLALAIPAPQYGRIAALPRSTPVGAKPRSAISGAHLEVIVVQREHLLEIAAFHAATQRSASARAEARSITMPRTLAAGGSSRPPVPPGSARNR
jgi:hypothetical protein